uniref:Uncharacterized protein n=1 Tax=Micrurus surinamensis TaxID=129470 RepID=A0A2D4NXG7_MICSU
MGLGGQVSVDGLVEEVTAFVEHVGHDPPVKSEVHLVETDCCHGQGVDLLTEAVHQDQLFDGELLVAVQDAQLHDDLDQVLDDLLGFFAVVREFLGDPVELIQDLAAGVVNEDAGHVLGGHLA